MPRLVIGFCALLILVITPSVKADTFVIEGGQVFITGISATSNYSVERLGQAIPSWPNGGAFPTGSSC